MQVLLFHDQNYGIHYEYTIPVNYTTENQSEPEKPQDSLFIWTHSGWEGCSVQCGGRVVGSLGVGFYQTEEKRVQGTLWRVHIAWESRATEVTCISVECNCILLQISLFRVFFQTPPDRSCVHMAALPTAFEADRSGGWTKV